jgi:uncharacterized protein (TIGR00299 family) protein
MKTLYFDCGMGAAGDMVMGSLLELVEDSEGFISKINSLGLDGVRVKNQTVSKHGVTGTCISVNINGIEEESIDLDAAEYAVGCPNQPLNVHDYKIHKKAHEHRHTKFSDISGIISGLSISADIKKHALSIYQTIAEAEAYVHGGTVEQIHFHEVGDMDAIVDIVGICFLMDEISPEEVVVSPIHVGSGFIRCSHGVLPVPAPATAYILQGIPSYCGEIKGELCTPTGAAVLKHFATRFGPMPKMAVGKAGYGMGKKDFGVASFLRVLLGERNVYDNVLLQETVMD